MLPSCDALVSTMKSDRLRTIWRLLPALLAVGCTRYQPLPLTPSAVEKALTVPAPNELQARARQHDSNLPTVELDPSQGLTPDSAAVLAVLLNPSIRADRNRMALSSAQLFQAGLLPNPQLTANNDWVTSGAATVNPFGVGINWDVTSLLIHDAKVQSAQAANASIRLDVAWVEWQAAQAARSSVYDQVSLQHQLAYARQVDQRLSQNADVIRGAVDRHEKTLLDLSAAQAAAQTAHADALALEQQFAHQRLVLLRAIGLPPSTQVQIREDVDLPSKLELPAAGQLLDGLENRRIDLQALRRGYEAEEQNVRAAIIQQFPKINLGFTRAEDNTGVHTWGLTATVDLPIFDQYQGLIRTEQATRQRLFDEYVSRIYQARSDIAMLLADIEAITRQISAATAALPALRQLVQAYQLALNQGNADVLSYYTAQNDLAQKEISLLKLKQQLVDSRIGLEIAAGRYLPQPVVAAQTRPQTGEVQP